LSFLDIAIFIKTSDLHLFFHLSQRILLQIVESCFSDAFLEITETLHCSISIAVHNFSQVEESFDSIASQIAILLLQAFTSSFSLSLSQILESFFSEASWKIKFVLQEFLIFLSKILSQKDD
jgi:hypothetical protein